MNMSEHATRATMKQRLSEMEDHTIRPRYKVVKDHRSQVAGQRSQDILIKYVSLLVFTWFNTKILLEHFIVSSAKKIGMHINRHSDFLDT